MWNVVCDSKYWPHILKHFDVHRIRLADAAKEHPLVKSDNEIKHLILQMGKDIDVSLRLLAYGPKNGLDRDCIFVVLTKRAAQGSR